MVELHKKTRSENHRSEKEINCLQLWNWDGFTAGSFPGLACQGHDLRGSLCAVSWKMHYDIRSLKHYQRQTWRQYRSRMRKFWRKHSMSNLLVFANSHAGKLLSCFCWIESCVRKQLPAYLCVGLASVKSRLFFLWAPEAGIQFHLCCSADVSWTAAVGIGLQVLLGFDQFIFFQFLFCKVKHL